MLNKTHAPMFAVIEIMKLKLASAVAHMLYRLTAYKYEWGLSYRGSHACIKISLDPSCTC